MATARKPAPKASPKPAKATKAVVEEKREWLRGLIGKLPLGELEHAQRYLEFLVATTTEDRALRAWLLAPEDDEPVTKEDLKAIEEGVRDIQEGRGIPHEEVKRRFGL
jgi:hypothetical protein